jgi:hypothetical protein
VVWRSVAAWMLGFALWWLLFFAIGIGIGLLWPEYRDAARVMFQEGAFRLFTTPMLIADFLLFAVAGIAVGRVSTLIARNRTAARILAALLFTYAAVEHYIFLWDQLPAWYNLIVPVLIGGFVWVGSRMAPRAA